MNKNIGLSQIGILHQIIDNLPVVVFEYTFFQDGTRDFTYLSPRCEELLGLKREVLLSGVIPMQEYIHVDDWTTLQSQIQNSVERLTQFEWTGRVVFEKNTTWIEAKGTPTQLGDGTIVCHGIITDITPRKNAESREKKLEQEYKDLLEFLPVGICIHAGGKILYLNRYAVEAVGARNDSDVIGRNVIEFIHPDFKEIVKKRIKDVVAGNPTLQIEEKYLTVEGKPIDVLSSGFPVSFLGQIAVLNIFLNITAQNEAAKAVKKTETLFSQLFQNAPVAIVMLNAKGTVVNVNHAFEEMFGFELSELKAKDLESFIVPGELSEEGNDLNNIISGNKVVRVETVRITKDKQIRNVIIYGLPVNLEDRTLGIFGLYVDITERKSIEEELKIRNSELDNFVYKVSHDLRAPLSSILGLVNLAKLPNNTDNLAEYIEIVGRKAEQLDHFIGDVLSHSKNLKVQVKIRKIDTQRIIDDTFSELTYLNGAERVIKNVIIEGVDFHSDEWRIKEIFRNLISNAIKYRNRDIENVTINIVVKIEERNASILFQDNGIGIDEDKIESIFEMFYRASEVSEGSGLGLYIVKNAIDKLNGTIEVESKRNQGTVFKISLPNIQLNNNGN